MLRGIGMRHRMPWDMRIACFVVQPGTQRGYILSHVMRQTFGKCAAAPESPCPSIREAVASDRESVVEADSISPTVMVLAERPGRNWFNKARGG